MFFRFAVLSIALMFTTIVGAQTLPQDSSFSYLANFKNLDGQSVSPARYLNQGPIVLVFFASWSKNCQQEINFLTELNKNYAAKGLKVVAVSFDRKSEDLSKFLSENKVNFDILQDKKLATLKEFQIMVIPTLFVLDSTGKIKNMHVDFDDNLAKSVMGEIKKLLVPES